METETLIGLAAVAGFVGFIVFKVFVKKDRTGGFDGGADPKNPPSKER